MFIDPIIHGKKLKAWLKAEKRGDDVGPIVVHIAKFEEEYRAEIISYEPDEDGLRSRLYGDTMPEETEEQNPKS